MAGIDPTIYLLDKNNLVTMALENIAAGTVQNNICLLPAMTFVKVTRVVNYVVSQTDVAAMDDGKCPEPSKAPDPQAKVKASLNGAVDPKQTTVVVPAGTTATLTSSGPVAL